MFVLPVLAYLLFLVIYFDKKKNVVESVVVSWLFVTLYAWLIMEVFSVFRILNTVTVLAAWGVWCIISAIYAVRKRLIHKIVLYCKSSLKISGFWRDHKTNLICLFLFCTLICLLSVLRSHNLIDNLYHRLTKIMHWIQNGSVEHFATVTPGEIKYTKLVEYMNAQIYLLKGPDRLIKLVQAGAYVCSGCCIYGIARKIGASQRFALASAWIFYLTPAAIIETFTAQTDVAAGFYLLAFLYFLLDYIHVDKLKMDRQGALSALFLSASVMFGYLAKPTVCFAMVFFFLWMCVVRIVKKDRAVVLLQYILIGASVAVILFLPETVRDYRYRHTPSVMYGEAIEESADSGAVAEETTKESADTEELTEQDQQAGASSGEEEPGDLAELEGSEAEEDSAPEDQRVDNVTIADKTVSIMGSPREFIVTCVRNLCANATTHCFPKINRLLVRFVEKCESVLNYSGGYRYFRVLVEEGFGETTVTGPAIMFFLFLSWICAVTRISKIKKEQFLYLLLATVSMVVQAGLMGYSWYNQRYLVGMMAVLCPVFAVVLENIPANMRIRLNLASALVTICSFGAVNTLSYEAPYIVSGFQGPKIHQYLFHDSGTELYYQLLLDYVNENGYETVGMYGSVSYEYILWQGIENLERMEHVKVNPVYFESSKLEDLEFRPQCIIEEVPEVFPLEELLYCNGQLYTCDWKAIGENGRNYAVLVPYERQEDE